MIVLSKNELNGGHEHRKGLDKAQVGGSGFVDHSGRESRWQS